MLFSWIKNGIPNPNVASETKRSDDRRVYEVHEQVLLAILLSVHILLNLNHYIWRY